MKEDVFPMELMSPSGDTSWRYVAGCSLRAERSEPIRVSDSASGTGGSVFCNLRARTCPSIPIRRTLPRYWQGKLAS